MPLGYNAGDVDSSTVTISSGGTMSTVAQMGSKRLAAILIPDAWTPSTLSLYAAVDGTGSTSRKVNDGSGTAKTVSASTAGVMVEVDPDFCWAFRNIQLSSSVAQGADRTLTLFYREV